MPKNVLIIGGYNWFGLEIIEVLLRENSFTNFIIVDSFQNQLWKDPIKDKFDKYRYLYDENIFLWSIDIKDKYKLEDIYKTYTISHVINNIKYNHHDVYMMEKVDGYRNIVGLNIKYNVQCYICLYRHLTHKTFALNHDSTNHVLVCKTFNQCVKEINHSVEGQIELHHVDIFDYIFGKKKDKYNDIITMYKNIIKCHSPCYVDKGTFYTQYEEDIIQCVTNMLLHYTPHHITRREYPYLDLYETIYYYMTQDCKDKEKLIDDDNELLNYIQL